MDGRWADVVNEIAADYNQSQTVYEVIPLDPIFRSRHQVPACAGDCSTSWLSERGHPHLGGQQTDSAP